MTHRVRRLEVAGRFTMLAALLTAAPPAHAQEHPLQFRARIASARTTLHPGEATKVNLLAQIPPGWHLYSLTQPPGGPVASTIEVGPSTLARISGFVSSQGDINKAVAVTQAVTGVTSVKNDMRLK